METQSCCLKLHQDPEGYTTTAQDSAGGGRYNVFQQDYLPSHHFQTCEIYYSAIPWKRTTVNISKSLENIHDVYYRRRMYVKKIICIGSLKISE